MRSNLGMGGGGGYLTVPVVIDETSVVPSEDVAESSSISPAAATILAEERKGILSRSSEGISSGGTPLVMNKTGGIGAAGIIAGGITTTVSGVSGMTVSSSANSSPSPSTAASSSSTSSGFYCVSFLESWLHMGIFVSYIVLYLAYGAWVHETRGIVYSPTMLVTSILITKFSVSFVAYLLVDGSPLQLWEQVKSNKRALAMYALPALAYATTDSLSVYCIRRMDPSSFSVLYNVRVVFMMLLFQRFIKIQLTASHWIAIALVVFGCVAKELPLLFADAGSLQQLLADRGASPGESGMRDHIYILGVLLLMAQCSAFASVFNEKLLKEQVLSLNLQNMAMYSWAGLCTLLFSGLMPVRPSQQSFFSDLLDGSMWRIIWSYPVVLCVFLNAALGLVTSFFIKTLNNVVREIACGCHVIGAVPVNVLFFGRGWNAMDLVSVAFVIAGVAMYNRNPLKKPSLDKKHDENSDPSNQLELVDIRNVAVNLTNTDSATENDKLRQDI